MTASKPAADSVSRVPSDTDLIAAARRGDGDAFDSLTDRHRDAALRLARRTATGSAEELVAETVAAVRAELGAGTGPETAFRPYLLITLRRRNLARVKRARRTRAIDELVASRPTGALAGIPAGCLPATARAYRALSENAQAALWHTEVEGEPLLDTATLLGLPATEVGELTFAARAAIRTGRLDEHRAASTASTCRWTTDRMAGHARNSLRAKDAARVVEHLESCNACGDAAAAVAIIESDHALLLATVVLGPAAEAYLGRESAGAAHARRNAGFAALRRAAARPFAVALSAIMLITAGLLGSMAFADDKETDQADARPTQITAIPAAPTGPGFVIDDDGPSSGSGRAGEDSAPAKAKTQSPPRPDPIPLPARARTASTPSFVAAEPAARPEQAKPAGTTVNLGVTSLRITPGGGPLGLPGLAFD